jgi:hypothetical protein
MSDYYSPLRRAVAGLEQNTVAARRAFYDRARTILTRQLDQKTPPLTPEAFKAERLALEDAIHKIELEIGNHPSTAATPWPTSGPPILRQSGERKPIQPKIPVEQSSKTSVSSKLSGFLFRAALYVISGVVLLALISIPAVIVYGGARLANTALDYLVWPANIAFVLCILVFLPLSFFPATRPVSGIGFFVSSFIFGASIWFAGLLTSYTYFGSFWTMIGLFFAGVGVVPLGMIGAIFHGDWLVCGLLFAGLALTVVTRAVGGWAAER